MYISFKVLCFFFLLLNFSCESNKYTSPSTKTHTLSKRNFNATEIADFLSEKEFDGTINLPEQTFGERIDFLNNLLKEFGLSEQLKVVADQDLATAELNCHGYTLKDPTFSKLLTCSMERYNLMYGIIDGEIRFMRMTVENIKAYPSITE